MFFFLFCFCLNRIVQHRFYLFAKLQLNELPPKRTHVKVLMTYNLFYFVDILASVLVIQVVIPRHDHQILFARLPERSKEKNILMRRRKNKIVLCEMADMRFFATQTWIKLYNYIMVKSLFFFLLSFSIP